METRSALLIGASGLVGGHVLRLLLDDAYSHVTALTRKSLSVHHQKLQEYVLDFDQFDQNREVFQGDDVFSCLGTTIKVAGSQEAFRKVDFRYVVQTAALASKNGAEQFLMVSAVGANASSRVFYSRVKGEVEDAVAKLPFKGIKFFRPSLLLGERKERRPGERMGNVVMKLLSFTFIGNLRKYRAITAQSLAGAMVRVAKQRQPGLAVYEFDRIKALGKP